MEIAKFSLVTSRGGRKSAENAGGVEGSFPSTARPEALERDAKGTKPHVILLRVNFMIVYTVTRGLLLLASHNLATTKGRENERHRKK